jgi:hypothetical protein
LEIMMISMLAFSMMATAQMPAAPQRQQLANCLRAFVNAKVQERMTPADFETAVAAACREQETTYRTAYIAAATRAGDRAAAAERDAGLEVEDLRANFLELFRGSQPE